MLCLHTHFLTMLFLHFKGLVHLTEPRFIQSMSCVGSYGGGAAVNDFIDFFFFKKKQ